MPTWEEILLNRLPVEVYKKIRYDMSDIFSAAYRQYPPAQDAFGSKSISELQQLAQDHASAAREYDPHEPIHEIQDFVSRLNKLIRDFLVAVIVIGTLTGAGYWVSLSRGMLNTLGSISQLLVSGVLGGSTLLALLAGTVLLYVRILSVNTVIVQSLNRALVIEGGDLITRDEEELVGYLMWDSSLVGGSGLKLLAIFSVLWILSAIVPNRDPYKFIKTAVEENIGIFADVNGLADAIQHAVNQLRTQDDEGEEPADTKIASQDD